MKKFLLAVLSVLGVSCLALGTSCLQTEKPEETQQTDAVVLNGFNGYDDVAVIYLDPKTFGGSMKLNEDANYIVEGDASYKCYIETTMANQPELKMTASGRKNDITDVSQFGLYVYNASEYEFKVIVTAYAGDLAVYTSYATVQEGVNNLVFDVNRAAVQAKGKVISDYSIAFSGVRAGSTFYLDNFYVKTTKEAPVITAEAQAVINDIDASSNDTTKETLEAIMDKYIALSASDKQSVANYERLETLLAPHWIKDLAKIREEDSSKLLYFGYPFASVQLEGKTSGVGSYSYSTEKAYGNENGSLKVNFMVSPTNWVNINTSAKTLIDEEYIEFYVYNDSDQYKAMCVGWHVPVNTNDKNKNYMILEPNAWTQVWSKSTDLTDSGNSSGAFEVCGLSDLTDRRACAPEGALYFSSVTKIRPSQEAQSVIDEIAGLSNRSSRADLETAMANYQALAPIDKQAVSNYDALKGLISAYWTTDLDAAKVNDANTLLYFDEEFGSVQVTSTDRGIAAYGYSTEKAHGTETGSLKIEFYEKAPGFMPVAGWMNIRTTATTNIDKDYILFYVYNDCNQYKGLAVGYIDPSNSGYGYIVLQPNAWTKVLCKSSDLTQGIADKATPPNYNYRGAIQIVALSDLSGRSVRAPEGALYFSSVQKFEPPTEEVQEERTGADRNTLFFFDRELGELQTNPSCGTASFSSDTVFNGENGALKLSFTGTQDESKDKPILDLWTCGYQFNEGDYVVFYVKADVESQYMEVRVGTKYGTYCNQGKWTQVIFPASALESAPRLRFYALNDGANYWHAKEHTNIEGDVYITKAKVYSADQIKNLSDATGDNDWQADVSDTDTYNIGQTKFVGKMNYYGIKGTYMYDNVVYGSFYDTKVALVGDTLRFYARSLAPKDIPDRKTDNTDKTNNTVHTVIGMELAEASDKNKMYIVASGLEFEEMYIQCMTARESGHFATAIKKYNNLSYEVLEDGYVRYCVDLSSYEESIKYFRLFTGQKLQQTDVALIHIRDVYFGD